MPHEKNAAQKTTERAEARILFMFLSSEQTQKKHTLTLHKFRFMIHSRPSRFWETVTIYIKFEPYPAESGKHCFETVNLFGNFRFRTGFLEMRCSASCCLYDAERSRPVRHRNSKTCLFPLPWKTALPRYLTVRIKCAVCSSKRIRRRFFYGVKNRGTEHEMEY